MRVCSPRWGQRVESDLCLGEISQHSASSSSLSLRGQQLRAGAVLSLLDQGLLSTCGPHGAAQAAGQQASSVPLRCASPVWQTPIQPSLHLQGRSACKQL